MDQSSNVNLSSTDASVSTIPTATPIVSEIISDFEPDPKFEITPLEKATFDCNDLFDNNSSDYLQQHQPPTQPPPPEAEHNGMSADQKTRSLDSVPDLKNSNPGQVLSEETQTKTSSEAVGDGGDLKTSDSAQQIVDEGLVLPELPISSQNDISSKNDCLSSSEKHDSGTDHLTATISLEESIAASALVQVAEGQSIKTDAAEIQSTKDSNSNQHQQYSAIDTSQQINRAQTEESEHANYLFPLSQTSVDAQMEKVIENIVELGEGHEFTHSLSQFEDGEKLLESIHREMTGVQSSIDLIADVASKQLSIEIGTAQPDKACEATANNGSDNIETTQDRNEDLITNSTSTPDKEAKPRSEENEAEEKVQPEATTATVSPAPMETTITNAKEDDCQAQPEKAESPILEKLESAELPESQPEPIVEEPPAEDEVLIPEVGQVDAQLEADKKIVADITVEPVESADEAAEALILEPVVEEAPSADELEPTDSDAKNQTGAKTLEELPKSPIKEATKESQTATPTAVAEKDEASTANDSGRRKSGRKVKVPKELAEESITEESKKSSRRVSSRKRLVEAEKSDEVKADAVQENADVAMEVDEAKKADEAKDSEDNSQNDAPSQKTKTTEEEPVTAEKPEELAKSEEVEESKDANVEGVDSETEPVAESAGQPSRSLRVRAPKRPHEEESPSIEPPKKLNKRLRGAADNLNKSSDLNQCTPTIKLPSLKTRMTISTSDPSTRPGASKERANMSDQATDKRYTCHLCDFATDSLNNIVYHGSKGYCRGRNELGEALKADITRQQQQAKGRRKPLR